MQLKVSRPSWLNHHFPHNMHRVKLEICRNVFFTPRTCTHSLHLSLRVALFMCTRFAFIIACRLVYCLPTRTPAQLLILLNLEYLAKANSLQVSLYQMIIPMSHTFVQETTLSQTSCWDFSSYILEEVGGMSVYMWKFTMSFGSFQAHFGIFNFTLTIFHGEIFNFRYGKMEGKKEGNFMVLFYHPKPSFHSSLPHQQYVSTLLASFPGLGNVWASNTLFWHENLFTKFLFWGIEWTIWNGIFSGDVDYFHSHLYWRSYFKLEKFSGKYSFS